MNGAKPRPGLRSTVNMEASKLVPVDQPKTGKSSVFWFSIIALIISTFISALDLSSVGIALPTITENPEGGSNFVWISSAYALSSTGFIPLSGKLADIFGRKPIMLGLIVLFASGSALAGVAHMNVLIAARRIIGLTWAFSSAIGPPIGGVIAEKTLRWLFFMNIPVCVLAFGLVTRFLNVRHPAGSLKEKIIRVDWIGNAIVIAGTTLTYIGLAWGGFTYPWSSVKVLVPLVLGIILLVAFLLYEFKVPREPTMPYDIFNRTTVSAFFATALHGITSIGFILACFGNSPIRSSVNMLPTALVIALFAIVCGVMVQVLNRYLHANLLGWTTTVIGFGLPILLKVNIIISIGIGVLWSSTIFPILAPSPVERTAAALGFFAFSRSFSFGITIASTILQNELTKNLPSDFVSRFPGGAQIVYAAIPLIKDLPEPTRSQVRVAFVTSWRSQPLFCLPEEYHKCEEANLVGLGGRAHETH
ncbi:iron permease [Mycena floridula]|nr:iron permease [Mycena floridula]